MCSLWYTAPFWHFPASQVGQGVKGHPQHILVATWS
uniref:Uncharacterized protein n=1 Tax=Anguilla anguilla TaxID=7936 RepID=A0A0E9QTA2_ANGAN